MRKAWVGRVSVLLCGLGSAGCGLFGPRGNTVPLAASAQAPAAQGEVKTSRTSDQNTRVSVKVKHLAPPDRMSQGASTYVVWARPMGVPAARVDGQRELVAGREDSSGLYNLGGLKIGKELDGELETMTPFKSFELFITAEPSSGVTAPRGERILWTTVTNQ
jgi:hypothetical protein